MRPSQRQKPSITGWNWNVHPKNGAHCTEAPTACLYLLSWCSGRSAWLKGIGLADIIFLRRDLIVTPMQQLAVRTTGRGLLPVLLPVVHTTRWQAGWEPGTQMHTTHVPEEHAFTSPSGYHHPFPSCSNGMTLVKGTEHHRRDAKNSVGSAVLRERSFRAQSSDE